MLWLLVAVMSFFWFFGWVIGSAGIFIHLLLLLAAFIAVMCLVSDRINPSVSHQ